MTSVDKVSKHRWKGMSDQLMVSDRIVGAVLPARREPE
ncbi:hypothetical protein C8D87_11654 [Lentzea atacamensis]|uniref:Uncharacterized protein n=1 Tax=Lentzea atacamensis TaxID=531938 RepID=A0ABX9DWY0_9PSEU|nr:hypothetical protein C8D87_11654 [Lentzea atacamensis]